ncbi:MAG: LpxI family protein [Myxococcota bacterium]
MSRTLGLIAGSGRLPFEVLEGAREHGVGVAMVAIEGNADPALAHEPCSALLWTPLGQLSRTIAFLKHAGAEHVILAGAVAKREALRDPGTLQLDDRAMTLLGRVRVRGDDALLRALAEELEAEKLPVIESTRYIQDRLSRAGRLAGPPPDPRCQADLALGLRVARVLGDADVGQSVVVREGTVLAVEAMEGTDATIRRGSELGGPGAVVVKAAKPRQDLRFDVPAIGPQTIELARRCALAAIGLEAGQSLILEKARTLAEAERAGLSLVGLLAEPS